MIGPAEAASRILAALPRLDDEACPLAALVGRVLAETIVADQDQPPFDRVAMDGIALASAAHAAGRRRFRLAGTQAAGAAPVPLPDAASCVEVMTGAMLPPGADAVVPVELLTREADALVVGAAAVVRPWICVHRRATDLGAGTPILPAGTALTAPEVAIVAAAGRPAVRVARQPRLMVISTGDELIEPGEPLQPWQVRRSNAYGIIGMLTRAGLRTVSGDHLPDDPPLMRARLRAHLDTHDVLILSGGVSAGRYDHVPSVLGELGVREIFHKVAQKPGRPLWFGATAAGRIVFGLPGNPVSSFVCLARYVLPALWGLQGAQVPSPPAIPLARAVEASRDLTVFMPAALASPDGGALQAVPQPTHGSGDFTALKGTCGFVELAPATDWAHGRPAPFYYW